MLGKRAYGLAGAIQVAEGYFIRIGDKTSCGGTVLSGDNGLSIRSAAPAREGDAVSCGASCGAYTIVGGITHLRSNGKLLAGDLDSYSGCPCSAALIASSFTTRYQSARPVGRRPGGSIGHRPGLPMQPEVRSGCAPQRCNHPDEAYALALYIAAQISRNRQHPIVRKMRALHRYDQAAATARYAALPWYARLKERHPRRVAASHAVAARSLWLELNTEHHSWDYRDRLGEKYGALWHKHGAYAYHYGLWANIHYGYVGMVAGFSHQELLDGSPPEPPSTTQGLRHWPDPADRLGINIGVELFRRFPDGDLTAKIVMAEVLAVPSQSWGDARRDHLCKP